eukprot:3442279-Pleurochrysis_carterae.AAC.1
MRGEIKLSPASRQARSCGAGGHAATLLARHVKLARKYVLSLSSFGRGAACFTSGKAVWLLQCRGNSAAAGDALVPRITISALVQAVLTETLLPTCWGRFSGFGIFGSHPAAAGRARAIVASGFRRQRPPPFFNDNK